MIPLRDYVLQAYGGFADRRHKDPSQDHLIKVDDQTKSDVSHLFCEIYVQVPQRDGNEITLTMHKAPLSAEAKDLIIERRGDISNTPLGPTVTLRMDIKSITFLRQLAKTIQNTVGRGKRYGDRNWKWSCGRTADSLDRFADALRAFRVERRSA